MIIRYLSIKNMLIMLFLSLLYLTPLLTGFNEFLLLLLTTVLIYSVAVSAWNIIGGFGGQLELGSAAYLGLGAYTVGNLFLRFNLTPWIGIFIGGLVAMVLAMAITYPAIRLGVKGVWYALTTISFVYILQVVFLMWPGVGGPVEIWLPRYGWSLYYMTFRNSYLGYFYIMASFLVIALLINYRIKNSRLGYFLRALALDEDAAMSLGINVTKTKLYAIMIYSYIVGVLGGVYVCFTGFMHPVVDFNPNFSLEVTVLGLVGGPGEIFGPFVSSLLLVSLKEYLRGVFGAAIMGIYPAIYATILIVFIIFAPRGIVPTLKRIWRSTRIKKSEGVVQ